MKLTEAQSRTIDQEILKALAGRCDVATYVIRNILDWPGASFFRTGLQSSNVLTACRRLERKGLIEEGHTPYAVMKSWRITPAGRLALSEKADA